MEMKVLGKTGINVSRLCIGSWQVSGWASSNDAGFRRTLEHALECGINFIDTAELYGQGHAESLIGEIIEKKRDRLIISSKFGWMSSKPSQIRKALEGSLKRLKTTYLDVYHQHWPPKDVPLEDSIGELARLKEEGKIRAVAVSNWMEPEWGEIGSPERIDVLQPCYNLLWRAVEESVLPLCKEHHIAVIPYSPLAQGLLTGRFNQGTDVPADWRKRNILFSPAKMPQVLKVVDLVQELSKKYQRPCAAVALRWLLDNPLITAPIVGASKPEQMDENLLALDWKLEETDWQRLSHESRAVSEGIKPHDSMWNFHPREM